MYTSKCITVFFIFDIYKSKYLKVICENFNYSDADVWIVVKNVTDKPIAERYH